MLILLKKAV